MPRLVLSALVLFAASLASPHASLQDVVPNDNRAPAGRMVGDTLRITLDAVRARWSPEGPTSRTIEVVAFTADGGVPQIPAPLLRVRAGTPMSVTVRNTLADSALRVVGLWSHPSATGDTVRLAPGESRTLTFDAGEPGTYFYGARIGVGVPVGARVPLYENETAFGAFIVDPPGPVPPDRVFVMNIWGAPIDSANYANALAINGRSWPGTERLEARTGDTLRWRIINTTIRAHPMHLHGFYFTLLSKGTAQRDTIYAPDRRMDEVTDRMRNMSTMSLEWTPTRPGNWLFHCHLIYHVVPEAAQLQPMPPGGHEAHSADAGQHMRGLVLGIRVTPRRGTTAEARPDVRTMRLDVVDRGTLPDKRRRMQYFAAEGVTADTVGTWRAGGPLLLLRQGEPTDINVYNHLSEATAVHWHGIELESYSDGVVGWSGAMSKLAPPIPPGQSFLAHLSLPRPGTFIYHTHLGDVAQLTAGLYGAIVVLPKGQAFDAAHDHVLLASVEGADDAPFLRINGDSTAPAPLEMRVGESHRFRMVNIMPAADMFYMIQRDSATYAQWMPMAKDGADLLPALRTPTRARVRLAVGETRDMLFTPTEPGEWTLRATAADPLPGWTRKVIVRPTIPGGDR